MRETLNDPSLARQAGRFVWLELDFDKPENQEFIARHGATYTPTLYVLDPADERATATHIGGMSLAELGQFLDQGERGVKGREAAPADAALARGDELAGRGRPMEAAASYREALRTAPPAWPARTRAVRELAWSLLHGRESQPCAETALAEAPGMPRESSFASVVLAGFTCANMGGAEAWAGSARAKLEPLAVEAVGLPATLRDDRFELYQRLMHASEMLGDGAAVTRWGERWLDEIEKATPSGDDERSALDIARVDAASTLDTPARVLPALEASERAMPANYNASLRLAQMETAAKRYDGALAACDRGLAHVTGPIGRSWLLRTRAEALDGKGDPARARAALEEAMKAAREIGIEQLRDANVRRITEEIAEIDGKAPANRP
jgi:predicted negative regulator of RcsB-dependent stress response